MATSDYNTFLAANVLNEGNIVSYRLLSRELKVHSNTAKKFEPFEASSPRTTFANAKSRMLYDFHRIQNARNLGSVSATYIMEGVPRIAKEISAGELCPNGEDIHMKSSPYMTSSLPQEENDEDKVPSRKVLLCRERDLQEARSKFELIHTVHVYSLGPSTVQNLQVLSDCNRTTAAKFINEDPLAFGSKYGLIQNVRVKRRTARQPILPDSRVLIPKLEERSNRKSTERRASAQLPHFDRPSSSGASAVSTPQVDSSAVKKSTEKRIPLKQEQSDIFKSFSKPKSQLHKEDTESSNGASPRPTSQQLISKHATADDPAGISSEEDEEGNEVNLMDDIQSKSSTGKSRSQREEELRQMMDRDDDEMDVTAGDSLSAPADTSMDPEFINTSTSQKLLSPDPPAVVTGGRRRGRRKVMKKKTIKDEEGYLVTKEEPAWESFSEDEPQQKDRTPPSTASSTMGRSKKPSGKPGQGNIMSFFGKK